MSYVKNTTAHYRQMLDAIIEQRGVVLARIGWSTEHFVPPRKTPSIAAAPTILLTRVKRGILAHLIHPQNLLASAAGEVLNVAKDYLGRRSDGAAWRMAMV